MFQDLIVDPLTQLLVWLTEHFEQLPLPPSVSAYAMALIAMAFLVKMVTYPLTAKQLRSMRKMQDLQPELKKLQKKHKDDREALARAQMEMYKEYGVNPFGGCLPLLIQMPVLWGLFRAISNLGVTMEGARFLWIGDLSQAEPLPTSPDPGLPLLVIIMVASQFAYQKFMTPPSPSDGDAQAEAMKSVMKFSPLIFAFIFISLPAGLVLYYTVFNIVSVAQQWFLNRESGLQGLSLPVPGGDDDADDTAEAETPAEERNLNEQPKRRRRRKKVG